MNQDMEKYQLLIQQARSFVENDQEQEAILLYNKAIQLVPMRADAHYELAVLHHSMGNVENAIKSFQQVVTIEPKDVSALNNLAVLFYVNGNLNDAEKYFFRTLEIDVGASEASLGLAKIYNKQDRFEEAIIALKKCLTHDLKNENANELLQKILLKTYSPKSINISNDSFKMCAVVNNSDGQTALEQLWACFFAFDAVSMHYPNVVLDLYSCVEVNDCPWELLDVLNNNNRILMNKIDDFSDQHLSADLFVSLETNADFLVPLKQAIEKSIPVLCAGSTVTDTFVQHGVNGLLLQDSSNGSISINELAAKIAFCAGDPEFVKKLGQKIGLKEGAKQ